MNLSKYFKVLFVHFEHIATGYPHSIRLTYFDTLLYKLGFEDYVVEKAIRDFDIRIGDEMFFEGVTHGNS